jgi:hypothetical protein
LGGLSMNNSSIYTLNGHYLSFLFLPQKAQKAQKKLKLCVRFG